MDKNSAERQMIIGGMGVCICESTSDYIAFVIGIVFVLYSTVTLLYGVTKK